MCAAGELISWVALARGLIEALTDAGRVEDARARGNALLQEALAAGLSVQRAELHLALAGAELAGGDYQAAVTQLQILAELRKRWPIGDTFGGNCHELRARIAIAMVERGV